jgi:class 3 adenylate cyclase
VPKRDDEVHKQLEDLITARVNQSLLKTVGGLPELPDGVVTIVFTDVEGSTELVRDLGDKEAHSILRRHDEIVRTVLADHDGLEVERAGDGFMLAFQSPTKALAFGLALRDALAQEGTVRVRIGMDSGEVIREEKGYFGRTVFRAARLSDVASGGRVYASEATKALADSGPFRFDDLGEHELKGLGGFHRVFEVLAAEEPSGDPSAGS